MKTYVYFFPELENVSLITNKSLFMFIFLVNFCLSY